MRCLINNTQQKDRFLNRAANRSLKTLIHAAEEQPQVLPILLQHLIGEEGLYDFDRATKTKTIERLLGVADQSNIEAAIEALEAPVRIVNE